MKWKSMSNGAWISEVYWIREKQTNYSESTVTVEALIIDSDENRGMIYEEKSLKEAELKRYNTKHTCIDDILICG